MNRIPYENDHKTRTLKWALSLYPPHEWSSHCGCCSSRRRSRSLDTGVCTPSCRNPGATCNTQHMCGNVTVLGRYLYKENTVKSAYKEPTYKELSVIRNWFPKREILLVGYTLITPVITNIFSWSWWVPYNLTLLYSKIICFHWTLNCVYFMGGAIHKFKDPSKKPIHFYFSYIAHNWKINK